MNIELDSYVLRARLWPALLAGLPAVFATLVWFPLDWKDWQMIGACIIFFGLLGILEHLGRESGYKLQPELFRRWDGAPTTRFLRHRDLTLNAITKQRYHNSLTAVLPGASMPTVESEAQDPEGADRAYESCGQLLRAKTRKKDDYPLVFAKNAEYGFRRNCLGLRTPAIWIGAVGLAGVTFRASLPAWTAMPGRMIALIGGVLDCLLLLWWTRTVLPGWVRSAADAYAEALLATCEQLERACGVGGAASK